MSEHCGECKYLQDQLAKADVEIERLQAESGQWERKFRKAGVLLGHANERAEQLQADHDVCKKLLVMAYSDNDTVLSKAEMLQTEVDRMRPVVDGFREFADAETDSEKWVAAIRALEDFDSYLSGEVGDE